MDEPLTPTEELFQVIHETVDEYLVQQEGVDAQAIIDAAACLIINTLRIARRKGLTEAGVKEIVVSLMMDIGGAMADVEKELEGAARQSH